MLLILSYCKQTSDHLSYCKLTLFVQPEDVAQRRSSGAPAKIIIFNKTFLGFNTKFIISTHNRGISAPYPSAAPPIAKIIGHYSLQNHRFSGVQFSILSAFSIESSNKNWRFYCNSLYATFWAPARHPHLCVTEFIICKAEFTILNAEFIILNTKFIIFNTPYR